MFISRGCSSSPHHLPLCGMDPWPNPEPAWLELSSCPAPSGSSPLICMDLVGNTKRLPVWLCRVLLSYESHEVKPCRNQPGSTMHPWTLQIRFPILNSCLSHHLIFLQCLCSSQKEKRYTHRDCDLLDVINRGVGDTVESRQYARKTFTEKYSC